MDKSSGSQKMCVVSTYSAEVKIWTGDRGTETEDKDLQIFLYYTMVYYQCLYLKFILKFVEVKAIFI